MPLTRMAFEDKTPDGDLSPMARYNPHQNTAVIYAAVEQWKDRCLIDDQGLFSPQLQLWTNPYFDELYKLFVQNLDEGDGTFMGKLEAQLGMGGAGAKCLMAEALWLLLLFPSNTGPEKKREIVTSIWGWSGSSLEVKQFLLSDEVLIGIGSAGTAYNTQRWRELAYLIAVARTFKALSPGRRKVVLSDPWTFSSWLEAVPQEGRRQLPHILCHLLFPDSFERIASGGDKMAIIAALGAVPLKDVRQWKREAIDQKLLELRKLREAASGREIDFYDDEIRTEWAGVAQRAWLLAWNPDNWNWEHLQRDRLTAAGGDQVVQQWRCVSSQPKEGDYVYLVRTGVPPRGIVAVGTVARAPYDDRHYDAAKADAGEQAQFIDVAFTSIRDANVDPIVQIEILNAQEPSQKWSPQGSGIEIKAGPAKTLAGLWNALPPLVNVGEKPLAPPIDRGGPATSEQPAKNLILYGPPGTGKTHRLLTSLVSTYLEESAGAEGRRYEFVTFHQSYSYEDFVEGIRPAVTSSGAVTYEVKAGVFRRLCDRAKATPGQRFAIFIDEFNRGNVAKIFGELITLVEADKRARFDQRSRTWNGLEVTLPYSGTRLSVPNNLDIIGTMNTADRSISLLDTALRRRFEFEELVPIAGLIAGAAGGGAIPDEEGGEVDLRRLLEAMNRRIAHLIHRDQVIGHAYLMKVKDFATLKRVMVREVIPLLQEYFYEDWQRIRLVLADQTVQSEHQLIRASTVPASALFPGDVDGVAEAVHYNVAAETEITPDAIRKIYDTVP